MQYCREGWLLGRKKGSARGDIVCNTSGLGMYENDKLREK
jgi:hypothetical protein